LGVPRCATMHVLNQESPNIGATVLLIRGHQAGAPIQSLEVLMSPSTTLEVSQMPFKLHDTSNINIRATPSARNDMGVITQFHKHIKCHPSI